MPATSSKPSITFRRMSGEISDIVVFGDGVKIGEALDDPVAYGTRRRLLDTDLKVVATHDCETPRSS